MTGLYDLLPESRPIDYALMSREYPKLRGALTRAEKSGDPTKVLEAVERFLEMSRAVGMMPDDWPRWRNALEEAWDDFQRQDGWELSDLPGGFVERFQRAAVRIL